MIAITGETAPLAHHFRWINQKLTVNNLLNGYGKPYRLCDPVNTDQLAGCSHLVHFAWSRSGSHRHARRQNLQTVETLASVSANLGIRFIFVSSFAAFQPWTSHYGRDKLDAEQIVSSIGGISVRPALVWGLRGPNRFLTFQETLKRYRFDIKCDGKSVSLHLVHADDIARSLRTLIDQPYHGEFCDSRLRSLALFHPRFVPLWEIVGRREPARHSLNLTTASVVGIHRLLGEFHLSFRLWEQFTNVLLGSQLNPIRSPFVMRDFA